MESSCLDLLRQWQEPKHWSHRCHVSGTSTRALKWDPHKLDLNLHTSSTQLVTCEFPYLLHKIWGGKQSTMLETLLKGQTGCSKMSYTPSWTVLEIVVPWFTSIAVKQYSGQETSSVKYFQYWWVQIIYKAILNLLSLTFILSTNSPKRKLSGFFLLQTQRWRKREG